VVVFRPANPEEVEQILELVNYVFRISSGLEPTMGRQFPTFICAENARNLYVAVDEGRIVAHIGIKKNTAMIYGHKVSMANMGSVCTHPDYRGKGIGTTLLHEVFRSLGEEGVGFVSISGTRGLYRRNSCVEVGEALTYVLEKDKFLYKDFEGFRYHVSENADEAGVLFDIYKREPVRYQRTKREFPVLLKAVPMVHPPVPALTVAIAFSEENAGLAYIIGYERNPGVFAVVEYAGQRMAVVWLMDRMLHDMGMERVTVEVPAYDSDLISVLNSAGLNGTSSYYPGTTLRVVSKENLWRDIHPIIEEAWDGSLPPSSIDALPDRVANDEAKLAQFLFSGFDRPTYGQPWDRVFPLPLPWPNGLNYV